MKNKIGIQDIIFLDEGTQVKMLIESKYGSLKKFYEQVKPDNLSLKAIRNYCSYAKVSSYTFKVMLVGLFEMGWDEIVLTPTQQLHNYVFDIFHNILIYDTESDLKLFEHLLELCIQNDMKNETAFMYRNIAKNYCYRDYFDKTLEYYNKAIELIDNRFYNTLIMLHVEMAEYFHIDRNVLESERHFRIAENYSMRADVNNYAKYTYYYRRGMVYNSVGQHQKAREYFNIALQFSETNTEVISETGAVLLAIGSSYKREKKYEEAKDHYFKSLFYFKEQDLRGIGSAFNNIADIYCKLNDYQSAIHYIGKAIDLLSKEDISSMLLYCAHTKAEAMLMLGDDTGCYDFFEMLKKADIINVGRTHFKHCINCMIDTLNDSALLTKLEEVILLLIHNSNNETYIEELYSCIGRLSIKRKKKGE